jgi:hypothetical protein
MSQQQHIHCRHSPLAHQLQEQPIFTNITISTSLISRSIYYFSPPEGRWWPLISVVVCRLKSRLKRKIQRSIEMPVADTTFMTFVT